MIIKSKRIAAKIGRTTPKNPDAPAAPSPEVVQYLGALKRRNASPKTLRAYRLELTRMEREMGVPMASATHHDLDRYLTWVADRGVRACTVNKSLNIARSWARWALKMDIITIDPTRKAEKAREEKRLPKRPTDDDLAAIFETLAKRAGTWRGRRNLAMIACAYYLGARASEVVGLDAEDIDQAAGRVRLFGKGKKERYVPLVPALAAILAPWLEHRPTGALFVTHFGARLTYDAFRHIFNATMGRAGLTGKGYTLHKLRHAMATNSLRAGMPLDKIQKLLGHSSVSTTQIYAQTTIGEDVAELLAVAL